MVHVIIEDGSNFSIMVCDVVVFKVWMNKS